jgi:hypothetical protein
MQVLLFFSFGLNPSGAGIGFYRLTEPLTDYLCVMKKFMNAVFTFIKSSFLAGSHRHNSVKPVLIFSNRLPNLDLTQDGTIAFLPTKRSKLK